MELVVLYHFSRYFSTQSSYYLLRISKWMDRICGHLLNYYLLLWNILQMLAAAPLACMTRLLPVVLPNLDMPELLSRTISRSILTNLPHEVSPYLA
jgi:hypothetical protein